MFGPLTTVTVGLLTWKSKKMLGTTNCEDAESFAVYKDQTTFSVVALQTMLSLFSCGYSYMQQREQSYLIVERCLIKRQKRSILDLLQSLPEGIIVYNKPQT